MARKEKQPIHKVQMTEGKRNIIRQLLQEYEIESAEDIQNALKDLLGGTIKEMMEAVSYTHLDVYKRQAVNTFLVGKVLKIGLRVDHGQLRLIQAQLGDSAFLEQLRVSFKIQFFQVILAFCLLVV